MREPWTLRSPEHSWSKEVIHLLVLENGDTPTPFLTCLRTMQKSQMITGVLNSMHAFLRTCLYYSSDHLLDSWGQVSAWSASESAGSLRGTWLTCTSSNWERMVGYDARPRGRMWNWGRRVSWFGGHQWCRFNTLARALEPWETHLMCCWSSS